MDFAERRNAEVQSIERHSALQLHRRSYADALNTRTPSTNGAVGLVPSYGLLDLSGSFQVRANVALRASINNLTDEKYFTKRPEFYPGPGVWPSDGRSVNVSIGFTF